MAPDSRPVTIAEARQAWLLMLALLQVLSWINFASDGKPHGFSLVPDAIPVVLALPMLVLAIAIARGRWPLWAILTTAVIGISGLVSTFAGLYWNVGTRANWSPSLSHLDAIYVALGTLTTAGTSGVVPKTGTARALLTAQLGTEVLLVPILLGVIIAAFTRNRAQATP